MGVPVRKAATCYLTPTITHPQLTPPFTIPDSRSVKSKSTEAIRSRGFSIIRVARMMATAAIIHALPTLAMAPTTDPTRRF